MQEALPPVDVEELQADRQMKAFMYPVRSRISRYLGAAAEATDEDDPEKGLALLAKLNPKRLNPYERALVYRLMAFVTYTTGDYDATIANFHKVLAEEVLPVGNENKLRFNIAQLHAALQQWREVIDALHEWARYVEEPDPLSRYLMGIAYFQLNDFDAALTYAAQAVDQSPEPAQGWLQLLAALYIQKEDYASASSVLEELVMRFPKKEYWVQLSLIYGARENYRHSLAVQQVAYLQGFLTEDKELRRLARSYLYHDMPYPAARVLEMGLEANTIESNASSFELLANSWIAAREYERSLPPLVQAAELSENGDLYVRLGQVYLQREEWNAAATPLQKAIEKGSLKNLGNAQLLLGIAYYNDERVARARSSFARARRHDSTRVAADRWIAHIENEEAEPS
jgi:tetratricopeptide (TPR) repeat protein